MNTGPFETGVAVAVVSLAFVRVGENFVRFGRLSKFTFGVLITRIAVGMILLGLLPIGTLDLLG